VDANAISPERACGIARHLTKAGIDFVDGGIIGPSACRPRTTWLYLSGARAAEAASYFSAGPLEAEVIGTEPGRASALKMCFAAYSKGSTALLCALLAAARHFGVFEELKHQWTRNGPDFAAAEREIVRAAPKSWRFVEEMHEISATFE